MPQVAVAAVASWASSGLVWYYQMAVYAAVSYVGNRAIAANMDSGNSFQAEARARQQMIRSSTEPRRWVYGRARVSGPLLFAASTGAGNSYLHLVIPLAGHQIEAVDAVYFNDRPAGEWDKFSVKHRWCIEAVQLYDETGNAYTPPVNLDDLLSVTIAGVVYDNVGTTVAQKLVAAGYEVSVDYNLYITAGVAGEAAAFTVDAAQFINGQASRLWADQQGALAYRISMHLGAANQVADADLVAEVTEWTTAHRLRGIAYLYVRLRWDASWWPTGIPNISAQIRGRNQVYDPRTATTGYTENAALCQLDYLLAADGFGCATDEVEMTSWSAAANICDEAVPLPDGSSQPRYTCNGSFQLDEGPVKVLEQLLTASAGGCVEHMGRFYGYAGADLPATLSLDEGDLRGALTYRARPSRREAFNAVRGTYVNAADQWQSTDFTPVVNAYYQSLDGGEQVFRDIELPYVVDATAAQRLAKVELERSRQGITVSFPAQFGAGMRVRPWSAVKLSIARLGWVEKLFWVREWQLGEDLGVDLTLQEYAPEVWDWNSGEATTRDLAPNTSLPDPTFCAPPTALVAESGSAHLLLAGDGTVISRIWLGWTAATEATVGSGGRYEVQYRRALRDSAWRNGSPVNGLETGCHITPVVDGEDYDLRVRAVNSLGVVSAWAELRGHHCIGKSAPPAGVTAFALTVADRTLELRWSAIADIDVARYEIRSGGSDWDTATFVAEVAGTSYRESAAITSGTHTRRIKAVDSSGNFAVTDTVATITVEAAVMGPVTAEVIDNNVLLRWSATAGTLPVQDYEVRQGADWDTAAVVGRATGTFTALFETSAGSRTYQVAARDIAGSYSPPAVVTATVSAPPDYVLLTDWADDFSGTKTNLLLEAGELVGSVNTTETYAAHFTANGWASPQDQINAGYSRYIEPTLTTASYVRTFDYGTAISSMITVSRTIKTLVGSPAIACTISVSANGTSWTDYANVWQVFAAGFRYVKVTLSVTGAGLYRIQQLAVKLDAKLRTDSGTVTASSGDTGGTTVNFAIAFVDIDAITVTPGGTASRVAVVDFTDAPNPTSFKVFLFDATGARVSGTVYWSARGK